MHRHIVSVSVPRYVVHHVVAVTLFQTHQMCILFIGDLIRGMPENF